MSRGEKVCRVAVGEGCNRTSLSSPRVLRYRWDWVWVPLEAPLAPCWLDMVTKSQIRKIGLLEGNVLCTIDQVLEQKSGGWRKVGG